MSLLSDLTYMLNQSSASKLKVNDMLRHTKKKIKLYGEAAVYAGFSPVVKMYLCCARMCQRDFSSYSGWEYRDEWAAGMRFGQCQIPFWDGGFTHSIVIIGEQGVGDEILWGTIIPEAMVRCRSVTYCCDDRMIDLFARSLPGLKTKTRYVYAADDILDGDYTAYLPAADLMPLFRKRAGDFPRKPYLRPDPSRLEEMEQYRGRIGLSWAGRHGRYDPIEFEIKNPLSLQYDETDSNVEKPHIDLRDDIEGVVALCSVLDKVVTVPASAWHFAAAVGTKTEVVIAPKNTHVDVIDELDYHAPEGESWMYGDSYVYRDMNDWKKNAL